MAIAKPAPQFQLFSGAMQQANSGIVNMPTAGRNLIRNYLIPNNPDTAPQSVIRGRLTLASEAASAITTTQKNGWKSLAANITRNGRLALNYTLNWIQAYNMVNILRLNDSQAQVATAPAWESKPPATSLTVGISSTNVVVTITHAISAATGFFAVRVSRPLPSAVYDGTLGDVRYIATDTATCIVPIAASPQAVTMAMNNFTLAVGNFVAVEVLTLSVDYVPSSRLFIPNKLIA